MYSILGEELRDLIGKSTNSLIVKDVDKAIAETKKQQEELQAQTSYFLTLLPRTVKNLKGFVKTKAYKINPEHAIMDKIDELDDTEFLEDLFEIILNRSD